MVAHGIKVTSLRLPFLFCYFWGYNGIRTLFGLSTSDVAAHCTLLLVWVKSKSPVSRVCSVRPLRVKSPTFAPRLAAPAPARAWGVRGRPSVRVTTVRRSGEHGVNIRDLFLTLMNKVRVTTTDNCITEFYLLVGAVMDKDFPKYLEDKYNFSNRNVENLSWFKVCCQGVICWDRRHLLSFRI